MILGGGPNRIGQGIEFDYCCVHAAFALKEDGFETLMVNCNPETVSTDYDTSDKLYFEPLTLEDVLNITAQEQPRRGHRPVRRTDAAEARAGAGAGRRPHHRHAAGQHRPGRGPGTLQGVAGTAGAEAAHERHRPVRGRSPASGREHRLSGAGAALLRARRTGHGDRLRGGEAQGLSGDGFPELRRAPDPHRQVPGRCHRGGRGRHRRRRAGGHRRYHGTHRDGRGPLGGQRLLDPPENLVSGGAGRRSAGRPWPWPPPSRSAG